MTGNIEWNGGQIIDEVESRIWQNMNVVAQQVVQVAQTYAPVKTGALRQSIHYQADRASFAVSFEVDVPYGIFVEYGTRHMMAHPYLRPALNTVGPQYGFDFEMSFANTPEIHAPVIAAGDTFRVPRSLTEAQRHHVLTRLKPVSQRHHIGNVSRAHLKVRGRRQY